MENIKQRTNKMPDTIRQISYAEYKGRLGKKITEDDFIFLMRNKEAHFKSLSKNQKEILKKLEEEFGC